MPNNKFKKYDHIEIEKKWQDYWYSRIYLKPEILTVTIKNFLD